VQGDSYSGSISPNSMQAMSVYSTPRSRKTSLVSSTPTPARTASSHVQSSPHYVTTRRHSLYGTEDRVIIDPGSRVWKIGFSGEARPRAVFRVQGRNGSPLWSLNIASSSQQEEEEHKILYNTLHLELRRVFQRYRFLSSLRKRLMMVDKNFTY
jgi:actin-related protein 10